MVKRVPWVQPSTDEIVGAVDRASAGGEIGEGEKLYYHLTLLAENQTAHEEEDENYFISMTDMMVGMPAYPGSIRASHGVA